MGAGERHHPRLSSDVGPWIGRTTHSMIQIVDRKFFRPARLGHGNRERKYPHPGSFEAVDAGPLRTDWTEGVPWTSD